MPAALCRLESNFRGYDGSGANTFALTIGGKAIGGSGEDRNMSHRDANESGDVIAHLAEHGIEAGAAAFDHDGNMDDLATSFLDILNSEFQELRAVRSAFFDHFGGNVPHDVTALGIALLDCPGQGMKDSITITSVLIPLQHGKSVIGEISAPKDKGILIGIIVSGFLTASADWCNKIHILSSLKMVSWIRWNAIFLYYIPFMCADGLF
jgi:hypothetical protein